MRREKSIFEAFLTKIKPTIFCLVSKALPLPRLALAFPTGQCGEPLYHRNDLASRQHFSTQILSTQLRTGGRVFKNTFLKFGSYLPHYVKGVQHPSPRNTHIYTHTPLYRTIFFMISLLFKHKHNSNWSINKTPNTSLNASFGKPALWSTRSP